MQSPTPIEWQIQPEAREILRNLDASKLDEYEPAHVMNGLGIVPKEFRGEDADTIEALRQLEHVRKTLIEKAFGKPSGDLDTTPEKAAFINFDGLHISVAHAIRLELKCRKAGQVPA